MTKKEYYEIINSIIKDTIATLIFHNDEIESLEAQIRSGRYSVKVKQELYQKISSLRAKSSDSRESALIEIKRISTEFCNEIKRNNAMKGEEMTDDAKLLTAGVKLSDIELEALFDKNAGNPTMERLICKYAEQNNIRIARAPQFKGREEFDAVQSMPVMSGYILKNYDAPGMYNEIMGEGSSCYNFFTSNE